MADLNPNNPVDRFTVDFRDVLEEEFSRFVDEWRRVLVREGIQRVFDFDIGVVVLPVLPVAPATAQNLITILLAANEANVGVYIEPDSLYTVGFVCHEGNEYALHEPSKDLLPNRINTNETLLKGHSYKDMRGLIEGGLDRNTVVEKLMHAIHVLSNPRGQGIDVLGENMSVIVQIIIEPIRFRVLQGQYRVLLALNARPPASRAPTRVSDEIEGGGYAQNDPGETQASGSMTVEVYGVNTSVEKWIENEWKSLSKIALEAHHSDRYKAGDYELKANNSYRLKNNEATRFETIEDLVVRGLGVAKEIGSRDKSSKSSKNVVIQTFVRSKRFLRSLQSR